MHTLSAVLITYNEELNIERCLRSLAGVADEVVVLDSYSTDRTEAICRQYHVRFEQHAFDGHIEQKNRVAQMALHPLVLSLDADEELSAELKASILAIKQNPSAKGYRMNRLNNYCGRWVWHSGWYPDTKLRLWQRHAGHWRGTNPHDRFELSQPAHCPLLEGHLLHYSYSTVAQHRLRARQYALLAAAQLHKAGKKTWITTPGTRALAKFIRNYLLRLGFLDGKTGLTICRIAAWETWLKYRQLRTLQKSF